MVSEIVEIIRERPAVAISVAAGSLVALGLFLLYLVAGRRRRRAEAAAAEQTARDTYRSLTSSLVDTLSHELYTPLTPVKGYASMLKRRRLPPEQIDRLADDLVRASGQLERLFDMMVALADVQRGDPDAHRDVVDLDAVVRSAADRVGTVEHPVSVSSERALPTIRANERLLTLAVDALLDNAVKFSRSGSPVRVDVRAREAGGRALLEIKVTDRGVGMTAEQLRVAFEPFRQIDGSLSRRFGGLGVGLALADQVARAHQGRLLASSRANKGSTFTLSIPLIPAVRGIPVVPWGEQHTG